MDLATVRGAFSEGCDLASEVMGSGIVAERWRGPSSLQGLSVGGIAGHLYGATRRFEVALDEELPDPQQVVDLPGFYGRNRVDGPEDLAEGLHPLVREDAERRAGYGPEAVVERFRGLVSRLEARLEKEPSGTLVPVWTVPDGVTPLADYLATRVVELVVHTDDLAVSVDLSPLDVPPAAASVVIGAFSDMARARKGDLGVIRAFARRERAEEGALWVL